MNNNWDALKKKYDILNIREEGDFIVIKGKDKGLNRTVLIKTLSDQASSHPEQMHKFKDEVELLATLKHKNVIPIQTIHLPGELDERIYIVTEWMQQRLTNILLEPLQPDVALRIFVKVLKGVQAFHHKNIILRNITPKNIFLSEDGETVKIGCLKAASIIGKEKTLPDDSPKYIAPEVFDIRVKCSYRNDIYSLGLIGYELFLGKEKFNRSFSDIFKVGDEKDQWSRWKNWHDNTQLKAKPLNILSPEIKELGKVSDVIEKMMSKNPEERFSDLDQVLVGLEDFDINIRDNGRSSSDGTDVSGEVNKNNRFKTILSVISIALVSSLLIIFFLRDYIVYKNTPTDNDTQLNPAGMANPELQIRQFYTGSNSNEIDFAMTLCRQFQSKCQREWYESEIYQEVQIKPFEVDRTEVTNRQFEQFVKEQSYVTDAERNGYAMDWIESISIKIPGRSWRTPSGKSSSFQSFLDYPVVYVSWNDAQAYCSWKGGRLPTEAEWEYSARGAERRIFPWGNQWDSADNKLHWRATSMNGFTRPVGTYPGGATSDGILDLSGNVWEWTSTQQGGQMILKGGSSTETNPANLRAAIQRTALPDSAHSDDGFRCVKDQKQWPNS